MNPFHDVLVASTIKRFMLFYLFFHFNLLFSHTTLTLSPVFTFFKHTSDCNLGTDTFSKVIVTSRGKVLSTAVAN